MNTRDQDSSNMKGQIAFQPPSGNNDFEVRSLDVVHADEARVDRPWAQNIKYFFAGIFFGVVLIKTEVISWYRIQEMFRLQSFHMYGVIGSAVVVGMISVWAIRRFSINSIEGEKIEFQPRKFHKGNVYGGLLFGFGWALTGACPGPLFALVGMGVAAMIVTLLSAIAGTWVYGLLKERLPH